MLRDCLESDHAIWSDFAATDLAFARYEHFEVAKIGEELDRTLNDALNAGTCEIYCYLLLSMKSHS